MPSLLLRQDSEGLAHHRMVKGLLLLREERLKPLQPPGLDVFRHLYPPGGWRSGPGYQGNAVHRLSWQMLMWRGQLVQLHSLVLLRSVVAL